MVGAAEGAAKSNKKAMPTLETQVKSKFTQTNFNGSFHENLIDIQANLLKLTVTSLSINASILYKEVFNPRFNPKYKYSEN